MDIPPFVSWFIGITEKCNQAWYHLTSYLTFYYKSFGIHLLVIWNFLYIFNIRYYTIRSYFGIMKQLIIMYSCLEHNPLWFLLDPLSLPGLHDLQDGLSTLPRLWRELPYPLKFYLNYTDYQRVAWTAFSPHATCVAQLICVQSSVQLQSEKIVYMLHIYSCKLVCFNHLKSVCIPARARVNLLF